MLARLVHEAERRRRRGKGTLMTGTSAATKLHRTTFRTSRLLDFASQKELIAQTGHQPERLAAGHRQGAGRQRARRLRGGRDRAGDRRPRRRRRDHRHRQRPGHAGGDDRGRPRLLGPGQFPRGLRLARPRRAGQRAQDARRDAVRPRRRAPAGSRSRPSGVRHRITFAVDPIRQEPVIRHERRDGLVKTGTA